MESVSVNTLELDFAPSARLESSHNPPSTVACSQRETGLIQNAHEFARTLAQYTSRTATDFLTGIALEKWQPPHIRQYNRNPVYFRDKALRRGKTDLGKREKAFRMAVFRAKEKHWWPLVEALKEARRTVYRDADVEPAAVYAECGLVWEKKVQHSELWCEWKPKRKKFTTEEERNIRRREADSKWRRHKWAKIGRAHV